MDDENGKNYKPPNFPVENAAGYPHNAGHSYDEDDDNEEEEYVENGDDDDDDDGGNGVQRISNNDYEYGDKDETDEEDLGDLERHAKKRKLKTLLSSYEFAPRAPAPSATTTVPAVTVTTAAAAPSGSAPKPSYGGRNPLTDWTEHETFVLLDAWGEQFLKQGRKSLRSEEWQAVADKVSQESNIERTDTQCRNRLDTLKKKYKKEKMKSGKAPGDWVYFKKLDELLSLLPQQAGLSCGVDSGEYVIMNPKAYANGSDEMVRDSPANSESAAAGEELSDDLPPAKTKNGREKGDSFKLLADSIQKFSDTYLKIENSKRRQMVELEKMRMEFHRDLELQKRRILERTQAEIEKIRQGEGEEEDDDNDNDVSN
ncbi:trihelix transcription factor ASIL2-like [Andrographis paniculata]|uniref:trihelix transcription factor ASIL2-like n=1 Tax=Andrographis paniculata TaxID=175694 RepID=UPI0021E789F7|nr:trihelix transcription factor ASIL2-like [Andrographis paniculata]